MCSACLYLLRQQHGEGHLLPPAPPYSPLALATTLLLLLCVSVSAGQDTETIRPAARKLSAPGDDNDVFMKGIPSKPLCGDKPFSSKCCNTNGKDSNCDGTAKIDEGLLEKLITGRILEALEVKEKPWIAFLWFPWGLSFPTVGTEWSPYKTLCVGVRKAPVDVIFLVDTTGSMGGIIGAVNTAANSLVGSLLTSIPNLHVGISSYKDFSDSPTPYTL
ncbi:hypothetical protein FOA52_012797 [Chlamydomonas sp. UWO 241]|nr:hypothetical protein FOA52_012797 [Chlamydomonas sp. UWO 241]